MSSPDPPNSSSEQAGAEDISTAERDGAVARLRKGLRLAVRTSGKTQRQIEKENAYGERYLSQVLNGHVTLTASHVLGILFSLDLEPGNFFAQLFADARDPAGEISEIRQRLTRYDSVIRELEAKGLVTPSEDPGSSSQPPRSSEKEDGGQ